MKFLTAFFHISIADFRERTRSYSYLVTLMLTIFSTYVFVKLVDIGYVPMQFGRYRSFININYVWTALVANLSLLITLVGFYLVKNSVDKDEKTSTGQIIAATPTTKISYIMGKVISNFIVLLTIVLILLAVISIVIIFRFKNVKFDFVAMYTTYFLIIIPPIIFVSVVAVFFDTIAFLRRGFGNVIYFFIWSILFVAVIANSATKASTDIGIYSYFDMSGFSFFFKSVSVSALASHPIYQGAKYNMVKIKPHSNNAFEGFTWNGIDWTFNIILCRLFVILIALLLIGLAALIFNRFDSKQKTGIGLNSIVPSKLSQLFNNTEELTTQTDFYKLSLLPKDAKGFSFFETVLSELRLVSRSAHWWWWVAAIVFIILGLVNNEEFSKKYFIYNLTLIWPTLIWSSIGSREKQWNTNQVVYSCAFPVIRQLPTVWFSGLIVALFTSSGLIIRLAFEGKYEALLALFATAVFIPSLALTLGVFSGTSKTFETVYLILWFLGPVNKIAIFDFIGITDGINLVRQSLIYLLLSIILLITATFKRRHQIRNN